MAEHLTVRIMQARRKYCIVHPIRAMYASQMGYNQDCWAIVQMRVLAMTPIVYGINQESFLHAECLQRS